MKKFIFILVVLIGSGILTLLSFWRGDLIDKANTVNIDFSEWEKLYVWKTKDKTFVKTDFVGLKRQDDAIYFHQLSPIDGIYYTSAEKNPFIHTKIKDKDIITFGSGLFVCNIQTGLKQYEFRIGDITLRPKGKGVFLIDTNINPYKIFSFDIFLDIELVNGTDRSHITNFTLFPSLLFKHDTKNTIGLKEADILRVSIVDSIRYVDMKTMEDSKLLFSRNAVEKNQIFLTEVKKDITSRMNTITELFFSILDKNNWNIKDKSFFYTYSILLINGSKKEILLKNTLVENILQVLNNPQKISQSSMILNTLSEMKILGPRVYNDGISILKQYYYISIYSHFIGKSNVFIYGWMESPFLLETERIITNNPKSKQGEYYINISNLFSTYYFLTLDTQKLNNYFEKTLKKMLDNKFLTKDDFLPFSFFVTQYLSNGLIIPNEDTILIISHLFNITNNYYTNNQLDKVKLANITTTIFYNYTKIFTKLYSVFINTFIDKTNKGLLFKENYLNGDDINFDQNFTHTLISNIDIITKDAENKKDALYKKDVVSSNSGIIDSYSLLKTTLKSFDTIISMLSNYQKYLDDLDLNTSSKYARGIFIEKENKMSIENVQNYLKDFNNLDIWSLQISNNFQKDGFYEIQVSILDSTFSFKLWDKNHTIADISYTDTLWKKHTFSDFYISLDQKEEEFKKLTDSVQEPNIKYKYDFKNFFENTFLNTSSLVMSNTLVTSPPINTRKVATPEIQLFIQHELLDKDFKNIVDFLPILFKNINAYNKDGERIIELSNIEKNFTGNGNNYFVEFNGKYLLDHHLFSQLTMKVRTDGWDVWQFNFNGTSIELLPPRITLNGLPNILKDLGYYIDVIKKSYKNQQSIIIDLTGKKVLLDNVPFSPNLPTP